ncbi:MAG: hypothetical protein D3M94_14325 [Rhodocyclales bacterium GT-UBC]|nr:MAG: hypothetical protein D3M94_14325 [Rhodocyclales bacterium GT-UBC]
MATMKTRLEAIIAHWASLAQFYGGTNAKRYRTNLKRASTAARETAQLFSRFEGESRQLVDEDIETLHKASRLLGQLAEDFEVAQRRADHIKADKEAEAESKRQLKIRAVMMDLFGTDKPSMIQATDQSVEHIVFSMARDLAYFDRAGVDEYAKLKGCDRGLISDVYNARLLSFNADRGLIDECAQQIAESRLLSDTRGYAAANRDNCGQRWYFAGWDDFLDWRKIRGQVRAVCQAPDPEAL